MSLVRSFGVCLVWAGLRSLGDVALGYLSLWTPVTPGALVKSLDLLELSPPLQNEGVRDEFIPGRCDSICGEEKESSNLLFYP